MALTADTMPIHDWFTDWSANRPDGVSDAMCAVLGHAIVVGFPQGTMSPVIPRTDFLRATGLGLTALRTALRKLDDIGLLTRRQDLARPGKANAYRLPSPQARAAAGTSGAPIPVGRHIPVPTVDVTMTLTAAPEVMAELIDMLAARGITVAPQPEAEPERPNLRLIQSPPGGQK